MEGIQEAKRSANENVTSNSIVEEARLYPETTGKRLGQIVRFDLQTPDSPAAAPPPAGSRGLGHLSREEEPSFRGANSELRQKARHTLENLLAGNVRFRRGQFDRCRPDLELLEELVEEQAPSAVVLACSDSRVPPEMVFDQGLGDLFVVRVAGNTVNDFVMGSILHAVHQLGVRLVVVLGHTRCDLVARAVHSWAKHEAQKSQSLRALEATGDLSSGSSLSRGSETSRQQRASLSRTSEPVSRQQLAAAAENGGSHDTKRHAGRGGFFGRLCQCAAPQQHADDNERHEEAMGQELTPPSTSASPSPFGSPSQEPPARFRSNSGGGGGGRSASLGASGVVPHPHRSALERLSVNPIGAIVASLQGAVNAVAAREGRLAHVVSKVHRSEELEGLGGTGLQTQDSLGITRARLAKQKLNESLTLLNQIRDMEGVEEVATQNTVLNAKAVLKGLAKCLDTAMIAEVEVVAAKFSLEDGAVKVIKRGWYSANARSFFYE